MNLIIYSVSLYYLTDAPLSIFYAPTQPEWSFSVTDWSQPKMAGSKFSENAADWSVGDIFQPDGSWNVSRFVQSGGLPSKLYRVEEILKQSGAPPIIYIEISFL